MGLADFIYNLLFFMLSLIYLPILALRRKDIRPYFLGFSRESLMKLAGRQILWVQAVSVGEVSAVLPILKSWREEHPDWAIVLTTTTEGGQAAAEKLASSYADLIGYFPLDFPSVVRWVLSQVQPTLFIMAELEIWPNFLRLAHRMGVRTAIINGRISNRSFPKYRAMRLLLNTVWRRVDRICAQTDGDAQRFLTLGALAERVSVTGNVKFDIVYPVVTPEEVMAFKADWRWDSGQLILTAASTHPGEEEEILQAYLELRKNYNCRLLLAPRHPDRRDEVAKRIKEAGLSFVLRSQSKEANDPDVLLLDTFGELPLTYRIADAVFVGGSLVPIGGHNILEAAAQHSPAIYGPHMHNFLEIETIFREEGVGLPIEDRQELQAKIAWLWEHPKEKEALGQKAYELVLKHRGATRATLNMILMEEKQDHA